MIFDDTKLPASPEEPRVHNPIPAFLLLLLGVGNLVAGLFPRNASELDYWWTYLLSAAVFLSLGVWLFVRFRRESRAHAQWERDAANWKYDSLLLEREYLESRLEREKLELERIKSQAPTDPEEK